MALQITSINSMKIKNRFYFITSIDVYIVYRFILLFTPVMLVRDRNGDHRHWHGVAETLHLLYVRFRERIPADLRELGAWRTNALTIG